MPGGLQNTNYIPEDLVGGAYDQDSSNSSEFQKAEEGLSKHSRMGFIRKVYLILCAQLVITAFFVALGAVVESLNIFLRTNILFLIVACIGSIVTIIMLICIPGWAREVPKNYILLFLFTIFETYSVGSLTAHYKATSVFAAAVLTAAVVIGLTVYAFYTKTDFTYEGGLLFMCCFALLAVSFIQIFFYCRWLEILICIFGVILFGVYLIYDTQLLLGDKGNKYEIDDYVLAALNIYVDIINMFIYILRLLGDRR